MQRKGFLEALTKLGFPYNLIGKFPSIYDRAPEEKRYNHVMDSVNVKELPTAEEFDLIEVNGEFYICHLPTAQILAQFHRMATITRIDPLTNTIWFSDPIPDGVKV